MKDTNKSLLIMLSMVGLYAIQFIILPFLFPYYYKDSVEADAMYWISSAIVFITCAIFVSTRLKDCTLEI